MNTKSTSIFQTALDLIDRLNCLPDFDPYIEKAQKHMESNQLSVEQAAMGYDPVTLLWTIFRDGKSLCILYNIFDTEHPIQVKEVEGSQNEASAKKANIYHFLLALKSHQKFEEDDLFAIVDLFKDDTNSFVKVLKTVSLILDRIEKQGLLISKRKPSVRMEMEKPVDNRSKVVMEMLETERKYIQDLEHLQIYMQECINGKHISVETIRFLFANLNQLLDFQRRFLIAVEGNALLPKEQQRFGALFASMEDGFSVYEPFCANYQKASDLAVKETPNLQALSHIIEPTYQLPSYLIKPIQRICKYPLLLRELIKETKKEDYSFYDELLEGQAAIGRVAGRVNETKRKEENELMKDDLRYRIVNSEKLELDLDKCGELELNDKFFVVGKDQKEREMLLFLFTNVIICCKELPANSKKAKPHPLGKAMGPPLDLRAQIALKNVVKVAERVNDNEVLMRLYWKTDEVQILVLKCRNEEQVKLWKPIIDKLMPKKTSSILPLDQSRSNSQAQISPNPQIMNLRDQESTCLGSRNRSSSTPDVTSKIIYPIPQNSGRDQPLSGNNFEALLGLDQIKVKIHYSQDVFLIICPIFVDYEELLERVDKKIRLCIPDSSGNSEKRKYRLRYKDEDEDFISLVSDEDVKLAFDSAHLNQLKIPNPTSHVLAGAVVNLYVD